MKILYYYWVQYDDKEHRGGGVRTYLENLIYFFLDKKNIEIYTLNSGVEYSLRKGIYIKKIKEVNNVKQYRIINSPIPAPGHVSFNQQKTYLEDTSLKELLREFLKEHGPFDIVHFQVLEGLSCKVLELKEEFKETKFILSVHNYHYFCPQVNLWKNEQENCHDFHDGQDCATCLPKIPRYQTVLKYYTLCYYLEKMRINPDSFLFKKIIKTALLTRNFLKKIRFQNKNIAVSQVSCECEIFSAFRQENIRLINKYVNHIFAVSERVKDICVSMGIEEKIISTSYIGTKFAENQQTSLRFPVRGKSLRVIYMGYMRKDKGFYFFIEALKNLNAGIAKHLEVVIAAKFRDDKTIKEIKNMSAKFKEIILFDGYTHEELPIILDKVNLGIVPVLWEDNLPQVAIELKSNGIPVLASNRGGASELTENDFFKFQAGDINDFNKRIEMLLKNPELLKDYWQKQLILKKIDEHVEELYKYYLAN